MKRVILHWTGGGHTPNSTDIKAYHFLIAGDGKVVPGHFSVSANSSARGSLVPGTYAAHCKGLNTDSIGISLCAMLGAKEVPFSPGSAPITEKQITALSKLVAEMCIVYQIPVTPQTVLTHAEVEGTLGVKQEQKWDIRYLPGYTKLLSATDAGIILRRGIQAEYDRLTGKTKKTNGFAALVNLFKKIFGK